MAQKAYNGKVHVHVSGMIEISGTTESNRDLEIYLGRDEAEILVRAFNIAKQMEDGHLGHAYWHAINPDRDFPCETCTMAEGKTESQEESYNNELLDFVREFAAETRHPQSGDMLARAHKLIAKAERERS